MTPATDDLPTRACSCSSIEHKRLYGLNGRVPHRLLSKIRQKMKAKSGRRYTRMKVKMLDLSHDRTLAIQNKGELLT